MGKGRVRHMRGAGTCRPRHGGGRGAPLKKPSDMLIFHSCLSALKRLLLIRPRQGPALSAQRADFLLSFLLFFCSGISGLQRTFSEQILENKVVLIMKKGTAVNSRAGPRQGGKRVLYKIKDDRIFRSSHGQVRCRYTARQTEPASAPPQPVASGSLTASHSLNDSPRGWISVHPSHD